MRLDSSKNTITNSLVIMICFDFVIKIALTVGFFGLYLDVYELI